MRCPRCDSDIGNTREPDDSSVGIVGGWYCDTCGLAIGDHEVEREPLEGSVEILPAAPSPDGKIGTPITELSGRPGHPGYAEFCRIARSWGYD